MRLSNAKFKRHLHILMPLLVWMVVGLVCKAGYTDGHADIGQGGSSTRLTAAIIHRVAALELMKSQLISKLDQYESEKSKCDLVLQDSQKAMCEDALRTLNTDMQALRSTFNATANGIEAEIAPAQRKADHQQLEILDRMFKRMSQSRREVDRRFDAVSRAG